VRFRSSGRHAQLADDVPQTNDRSGVLRGSRTAWAIPLIAVASVSALAASAAAPADHARPTAHQRPEYLLPVGTLVHHGYLPFPALLGDSGHVGVPSGTKPTPAQPDQAVVARQAPAIVQFQGATGTLTPAGIATLALEHGCDASSAATATAIAMAESGGSPAAQGDIGLMTDVWDWSAGLWQIRGLRDERGTGGLRDSIANQDAEKNASAMYVISSGCTEWTPWSTYNSGVYETFLPIATQAVRYVVAYYAAHGRHYPSVGAPDPTATIPVQGSGGTTGVRGPSSSPTSRRTPTPKPKPTHSAAPRQAGPTAHASSSAAPPPARTSPAQPAPSTPRLSLPVPKPTLSVPSVPLPTPSLTLPLPKPSLSLPSLPGLP
jgi:Lysozyme like domain